jgi:peptide/nickel transport system substrate-binding protein
VLTVASAAACSSSSSNSSSSSSTSPSASTSTSASASPSTSPSSSVTSFPRTETLYTSGTAYAPPTNWNPLDLGNFATGTQGLVYEPLFLYDPIKSTYQPWLASAAGTWSGSTYTLTVRSGINWSDGTPFTGADVAYSINLARTNSADPFNANVATVTNATASGNTVTVTFKGTPGYTEWQGFLWRAPILPQHIWSKLSASAQVTGANTNPVGTGPMTVVSATAQQVAYQTRSDWWATSALGLSFKFKYLVDVVNGSNNQELGALTAGDVDWSNNFLPGINNLITALNNNAGYGFKTFYPKSPYMLSANTVWLEPNTTKAPMNNVNFRKALAYGLNPTAIAQTVYGGIAQGATPTGLLPTLDSAGYVDHSVVSANGFSYDPTKAKQFLAQSGYHGQPVTLQVPDGWTDWMQGIQVIQQELSQIGINIQLIYPQYPARTANLTNGTYDLALDNNAGLDSTPWSYFQRVYQLPINKQQTAQENWERFNSPKDWALVQEAGSTPLTDTAKLKGIYSTLEKDFLTDLPEIPVWYNGAWFQGSTKYWQDYPQSGTSNQNMPVMWGGYIGAMTTVYALANLKPVPQTSG